MQFVPNWATLYCGAWPPHHSDGTRAACGRNTVWTRRVIAVFAIRCLDDGPCRSAMVALNQFIELLIIHLNWTMVPVEVQRWHSEWFRGV
eukprot:1984765-Rhodomonas_salina.2